MLKKIGRLDADTIDEIEKLINSFYRLIENEKYEKAEKKIFNITKTPNFFIREYIGEKLSEATNIDEIEKIADKMLKHKIYGIRATALFFYFFKYENQPERILKVLDTVYDDVPWETEKIVNKLWKKYPSIMKKYMSEWIKSEDEKKRALAFHGMENISRKDPFFIMDFVGNVLDDNSIKVQKKITHILTQVARTKPAESYPYIRKWLIKADNKRKKTIWISMKKLVNILNQRSKRDKSEEFIILTKQTISNWRRDKNKNVKSVGSRLYHILKKNKKRK